MVTLLLTLGACGGGSKRTREAHADNVAASPGIRCIEEAKTVLQPPTDAPERIDVAHILVRHAGVRNAQGSTRTKEEACLRAMEAREKLLAGGEWDSVGKEFSDSLGASGGVFYDVTQGSLEPAFAGAAFSLKVDELSYVVETRNGYHIIWRKK